MSKPLFPDVAVNGETIPSEDIAAEAQNHPAPQGKPGLAWRKAARALAVRALLLQEAARRGLSPAPREVAPGRHETGEEALIRAVTEEAVAPEAPDEEALRAAYEAEPDRYRSPALYAAAHLLFAADPSEPEMRAAARDRAGAVLAELACDPERFERLAREKSDCPSRDNGGRLGQVSTGDTVPEFEAALDAAEPGEIVAHPVESRYGFHVIRLDAREEGAVLPYDSVRPRIAEALEKAAWARAAREFIDGLVATAEITGTDLKVS